MLITLDGNSGSGKTTQLERLELIFPTLNRITGCKLLSDIGSREYLTTLKKGKDVITDWYVNYFVYDTPAKNVPLRFKELNYPFNTSDCYHFVFILDCAESEVKRVIARGDKYRDCFFTDAHRKAFEHTTKFYKELIEANLLIEIDAMKPINVITDEIVSHII